MLAAARRNSRLVAAPLAVGSAASTPRHSQRGSEQPVDEEAGRVIFSPPQDLAIVPYQAPGEGAEGGPGGRRTSHHYRKALDATFGDALRLGKKVQKQLQEELDGVAAAVMGGVRELDQRVFVSPTRSSAPREMAEGLRAVQTRFEAALTHLGSNVRRAIIEFESFLANMPTPPHYASPARGASDDWQHVGAAEVGAGGGGGSAASSQEAFEAVFGQQQGLTRIGMVSEYLVLLEDAWVELETVLEDSCEKLSKGSASMGPYQAAAAVGEGVAAGATIASAVRFVASGFNPLWGAGFFGSLMATLGLDRYRRELGNSAGQLQDLRNRTRRLSKTAKLVVEDFRHLAINVAMETGGGLEVLDCFEARRDALLRNLITLRTEAEGL